MSESQNLTNDGIKTKFASGIVMLGTRRILFLSILYFTNIILYRQLSPEMFGTFGIIHFLVLTLGVFTNFGLSQALIQRRETLKKKEMRAIFTTLVIAGLLFTVIVYFLAPLASILYKGKFGEMEILWLRLYALYILFNNPSAVSMGLLERKLDYKKLTIGEVATLLLTQLSILFFVFKGLGVGSFVLGTILGKIFSFVFFLYLSPWPVGFNFNVSNIKRFLPFGLNFQANSIIDKINSAIVPGFAGAFSGPTAVGLINWAGGVRQAGLAPYETIERFVFPASSRAQDNKILLKSLVEKMIKLSCLLSFPILAAIFALAPSVTSIIYTSKWLPGLTALYLSLAQGIFLILNGIFINVLFALGHAKTVRNISIFWVILQWMLTIFLVLFWNFNGAVLASLIVSATFFIPMYYLKREIKIDIWSHVLPYLMYSIVTGAAMFGLAKIIVISSIWHLFLVGLAGIIAYWGIVFMFQGKLLLADLIKFKNYITSSN